MAKLTFLWYDYFGKKERSLQMNGITAIPKSYMLLGYSNIHLIPLIFMDKSFPI